MSESQTTNGEAIVTGERNLASRVAALALIAGIFPVIGTVIQSPLSGAPKSFLANLIYYTDHGAPVLAGSILRGVGLLALAAPVLFLLAGATARGAKVPRFAPGITVVGAIAVAIGTIVLGFASVAIANEFKDSGLTYDQAKAVLKGPIIMAASGAGLLGTVGVAFGLAMGSLNAMRVGMLTRFMGYVGILSAVLMVIPIFSPVPVVQMFWLVALAVLILGRWPGGNPPTWKDGLPHPWPTAAEQRAGAQEDDAPASRAKRAKQNGN